MAIFVKVWKLFTTAQLLTGDFYISFYLSRGKKSERIEPKFKTQNLNLRFSSWFFKICENLNWTEELVFWLCPFWSWPFLSLFSSWPFEVWFWDDLFPVPLFLDDILKLKNNLFIRLFIWQNHVSLSFNFRSVGFIWNVLTKLCFFNQLQSQIIL